MQLPWQPYKAVPWELLRVAASSSQVYEYSNRTDPYRVLLDLNKRQAVNLLYLAPATSRFDYACKDDGHSEMVGARVR